MDVFNRQLAILVENEDLDQGVVLTEKSKERVP